MPIYEYCCKKCGRSFEELRRMDDRSRAPCPGCGAASAKTLSTFAAVTGSCRISECSAGQASGSCCNRGSCGCS